MPPLESISPMATDPPTLPPFDPPIQRSRIVGQVFNFDEVELAHDQQSSSYPRVEDTSSLDQRPDIDIAMEDVVEISGVTALVNAVNIELALWRGSLDGWKDAITSLRSFEDDEDERGHGKQSDVRVHSHLNITGVDSGQALSGRDPTILEPSR